MTVDALRRRVSAGGGFAAVLARGDEIAGGILLLVAERGAVRGMLERVSDLDGHQRWAPCGPPDVESAESRTGYIERRRRNDPDLWVLELDGADAERFIADLGAVG